MVAGPEMVNCVLDWAGRGLVVGGDCGQLTRRCPNTGQMLVELAGHTRRCGISALAANQLGLWSASFDCKLRLWDEDGSCLCLLRQASNQRHPHHFQKNLETNYPHLWSYKFLSEATDVDVGVASGHNDPVRCLAVDESRLVSGDYRGFSMIWHMEDIEQEVRSWRRRPGRGEGGVYSLQGGRVVQQGGECEVVQHNSLLEHRGNVTCLAMCDGTFLASGSRDRTINIHCFDRSPDTVSKSRKSYL